MREIKPSHKNLYTLMTWKMSKLLNKLAGIQDESTPYGLGVAKSMVKQAKDYLKKSKKNSGDKHPKESKIEELDELLAKTSNILVARKGLMLAKEFIQDAEQLEQCGQRTMLVMDAIDQASPAVGAAHDAQEHFLEAQLNGTLGYIFFKLMTPSSGENEEASNAIKLKQLKKA